MTSIGTVDDETYDYYHNLYWVARNPCIDKNEKLRIGNEPAFREQSEILTQYFYAYRTFNESLFLMGQAVERGEHPNKLRPSPDYIHKPLPQSALNSSRLC